MQEGMKITGTYANQVPQQELQLHKAQCATVKAALDMVAKADKWAVESIHIVDNG
jgi:hypothetical protein